MSSKIFRKTFDFVDISSALIRCYIGCNMSCVASESIVCLCQTNKYQNGYGYYQQHLVMKSSY